jgi:hypothetical protein
MKKTLASFLFLMVVFLSSAEAQEISHWEPLNDGNMKVTIRVIDKDGIHEVDYKYPIKAPPEAKPECAEFRTKGNEIWLLTQESFPVLYIVDVRKNEWNLLIDNFINVQ